MPAEPADSPGSRFTAVQEGLATETDTLPQPAGFGSEVSTSQQAFETIDTYTVPPNTLGELQEVAVSIEGNGEVLVNAGGVQFGPYTGPLNIEIPLDRCVLAPGSRVVVKHQSTDGTSTTTRAQVVVAEV